METSTPVFCLLTLEYSHWALKSRPFFRYADAIFVSKLTDLSSCKMKMALIEVRRADENYISIETDFKGKNCVLESN